LLGKTANEFINTNRLEVDLVSSHGHTIFHQPQSGFTCQIGDGAAIAAECQKTVVCDFRSLDVALGGQGAPLVPIGDKLLFSNYEYCLNLGGIANISFSKNDNHIAFDICPVNQVLNRLASEFGFEYDNGGQLAQKGKILPQLLKELNNLPYYQQSYPKSLGKEWVDSAIWPIISQYQGIENILCTFTEHAGIQIGDALNNPGRALVTGGGTHNDFLIERINHYAKADIIIPDKKIIDFKEALIFAFLGLLRFEKQINTLKTATGAKKNSSGGCIYFFE
jgi:anhydro-N-acetylmuramic acid kinase